MIGYIVGLGDRHVANMLIDEKTAEIIHIDFGNGHFDSRVGVCVILNIIFSTLAAFTV